MQCVIEIRITVFFIIFIDPQATLCACGCGTQYQHKGTRTLFWIQCDWCDGWWLATCIPLSEEEEKEYKKDKRKKFRCGHC